jgi:hypothetical protein
MIWLSSHNSRSASAAITQLLLPTAIFWAVCLGPAMNVARSSVSGGRSFTARIWVWNRSVSRSNWRLLVPKSAQPGGRRSR